MPALTARLKRLPLAARIVMGLALGAVGGLALPGAGAAAWSDGVVASAGVIGRLWLAALQMTILPLVFALLSTTFIRSAGLAEGTGVTRRTIATLAALYALGIAVGVVVTPILLGVFPVTGDIAAALRGTGGGPVEVARLPVADMILGLVPTNVVSAAAGGSLLPVVFFALVFGAAPALAVLGIPIEFLAVIIVAETIPDMFKTVCNITMDVAAASVVDRSRPPLPGLQLSEN